MKASDYQSLPGMFFQMAKEHPKRDFLSIKEDGRWKSKTWRQSADEVRHLATGLKHLGIQPGERVALISENRPEWVIAELAIMAIGAIAVPAYTTNTTSDHSHILTNSGASAAIVSTRALAKRLLPAALESTSCRFVVTIEPLLIQQKLETDVHVYDAVLATGKDKGNKENKLVDEGLEDLRQEDAAVLIYTSGTGGAPKGVVLSHRAILTNCMGANEVLADWSLRHESFLSFLPLSHAYEHMAGLHFPISLGATIYFAESVDKLVENMGEVKPTIMTAVPRLHEAIRTKIIRGLEKQGQDGGKGKLQKQLFDRTIELGRMKAEGKTLSTGQKIQDRVLERLVRAKIRNRFGGRLKAMVSGGAALNEEVGLFFESIGLCILQGYGQTEAAPLLTVNRRNPNKLETVGPAVKGVTLKIAHDGEVIAQGGNLMNGYWKNDKATNETIIDGWLHTGDIGELDADGYLTITDRKKDIIVNSGGDNVSPARIEGFLTLENEIGQAMVYGDKKPNLVAIIVPDQEFLNEWCKANN
ncbi:MAG: AMP-dependent synthetase/ligase, partial [Alphaproteobacteria bacterium]